MKIFISYFNKTMNRVFIYSECYTLQYYYFLTIPKDEIVGNEVSNKVIPDFEVSQNFPNPFAESTTIKVILQKPTDLNLEIINMLGETVYELASYKGNSGLNSLNFKADYLTPGVYFYTVTADLNKITKKMIIN